MSKYIRIAFSIFILTIIIFIAVFVWPTMYRYDKYHQTIVRTNRFSGESEGLTGKGWIKLRPYIASDTAAPDRPPQVKYLGPLSKKFTPVRPNEIELEKWWMLMEFEDGYSCDPVDFSPHKLINNYDCNVVASDKEHTYYAIGCSKLGKSQEPIVAYMNNKTGYIIAFPSYEKESACYMTESLNMCLWVKDNMRKNSK